MTTNFPVSLDDYSDPSPTASLTGHAQKHTDLNDAVEAIEHYVGVSGSAVAGTITKRVADLESAGGVTVDSVNGQTGVVVLDASDVGADAAGTASSAMSAHLAAGDPHSQYLTVAEGNAAYDLAGAAATAEANAIAAIPSVPAQFNPIAGTNMSLSGTYPNITFDAAGGGGGGGLSVSVGLIEIDFGSAPGSNIASASVTGQTSIVSATSSVKCWRSSSATSSHNQLEHLVVPMQISVSDIIDGVGFIVTAYSELRLSGTFHINWEWI